MNDIDNKINHPRSRIEVCRQSTSRGARRSDAQEVDVEVPCDLDVEAPFTRR